MVRGAGKHGAGGEVLVYELDILHGWLERKWVSGSAYFARSGYHTQLAKMSFDKTFDLTAGGDFNFYRLIFLWQT